MTLLDVKNLNVQFQTMEGIVTAVDSLSFSLEAGETLGLVGESGSGKSQTAFALLGLLAKNDSATGVVRFNDQNLVQLTEAELNRVRAEQIAMIFQDPMTSLNPYLKIGPQLMEVLRLHKGMSKKAAFAESIRMLDAVKMPDARNRMNQYPHEFSGGMRQRIVIAMALLCQPQLLIADEPTTALDVTVQAQIMALLKELKTEFNTSIILISHDLGVIAEMSNKVLVLYAGQKMEYGAVEDIFYDARHPYTQALLKSIPRIDHDDDRLLAIPGNPPNLLNIPTGCPFLERCTFAQPHCSESRPPLEQFAPSRQKACYREITAGVATNE